MKNPPVAAAATTEIRTVATVMVQSPPVTNETVARLPVNDQDLEDDMEELQVDTIDVFDVDLGEETPVPRALITAQQEAHKSADQKIRARPMDISNDPETVTSGGDAMDHGSKQAPGTQGTGSTKVRGTQGTEISIRVPQDSERRPENEREIRRTPTRQCNKFHKFVPANTSPRERQMQVINDIVNSQSKKKKTDENTSNSDTLSEEEDSEAGDFQNNGQQDSEDDGDDDRDDDYVQPPQAREFGSDDENGVVSEVSDDSPGLTGTRRGGRPKLHDEIDEVSFGDDDDEDMEMRPTPRKRRVRGPRRGPPKKTTTRKDKKRNNDDMSIEGSPGYPVDLDRKYVDQWEELLSRKAAPGPQEERSLFLDEDLDKEKILHDVNDGSGLYANKKRNRRNGAWVHIADRAYENLLNLSSIEKLDMKFNKDRPIFLLTPKQYEKLSKELTTGTTKETDYPDKLKKQLLTTEEIPPDIDLNDMAEGMYGIVPPHLLYCIYSQFENTPNDKHPLGTLYALPWAKIRIPEDPDGKEGTMASYCQIHWENDNVCNGKDSNFKSMEAGGRNFSQECLEEMESFCVKVLKSIYPSRYLNLGKEDIVGDVEGDKQRDYKIFPSFIATHTPYNQHFHIDDPSEDDDSFFIHFALTHDGTYLRLLKRNESLETATNVKKIHIPFGSFFVIRNNVYHSGVYGREGNVRMNIIVRHHASSWYKEAEPIADGASTVAEYEGSKLNTSVNLNHFVTKESHLMSVRYLLMLFRRHSFWFKMHYACLRPMLYQHITKDEQNGIERRHKYTNHSKVSEVEYALPKEEED